MHHVVLNCLFSVLFSHFALSHSWNEQLTVIRDGLYTGNNGYPRRYVSRSEPGFNDSVMTYVIPSADSNRTRINDSDFVCSATQRNASQAAEYPRLQAVPGDYIAIKYLENGHVTLPQNTPGKPPSAGVVYVFGTEQPNEGEKLTDVLQWTADGTGGDQRGVLLAVQNFDDGRCYQINNGTISSARQQSYPDPTPGQPGTRNEQWCETDIKLPSSLSEPSAFTIYWVWQWPTLPGTPGVESGKDEYYTTCSDINLVPDELRGAPQNPLTQQDPQTAAVSNYKSRTADLGRPVATS